MLDGLWLGALLLIDATALWFHAEPVTFASTLALLISAAIVVTRRWCLAGVVYERHLSAHRALFGERVELITEVRNLKPIPLAWLRVSDDVPPTLPIEGGLLYPAGSSPFRSLYGLFALLPYERVRRRMQVLCLHRGEHRFGPVLLESGDFLGLVRRSRVLPQRERLIVTPKCFPLVIERTGPPPNLGPRPARHPYLTDPMSVIGARHYVAGDPYRMIDWRATARAGRLQVRQLEPSLTPVMDLVLDVSRRDWRVGYDDPDEVEFAISVAVSIAAAALQAGWSVGLRCNGTLAEAPLSVLPAATARQLARLTSALARLVAAPGVRIETLLRPPLPCGNEALVLIVTAAPRAELVVAARALVGRAPLRLVHVAAADAAAPAIPGVDVWRATYAPRWYEQDALVLRG